MSFSVSPMSKLTASLSVAAAAVAFTSSAALAGGPAVMFDFLVNGESAASFNPEGTDVGGGVFNYEGQLFDPAWTLSWDLNAKADPFISGNIVITNNSLATATYSFTVLLPVSPSLPSSLLGGSVAGGLTTDLDGGMLSTVAGSALWTASIDGSTVATLINDPFSVSLAGAGSASIGPASFGSPIPSMPFGAVNNSMAITLEFTLTPGDQASFTSVFVAVIPGPGGLAMLAIGGLLGGRTRRRA